MPKNKTKDTYVKSYIELQCGHYFPIVVVEIIENLQLASTSRRAYVEEELKKDIVKSNDISMSFTIYLKGSEEVDEVLEEYNISLEELKSQVELEWRKTKENPNRIILLDMSDEEVELMKNGDVHMYDHKTGEKKSQFNIKFDEDTEKQLYEAKLSDEDLRSLYLKTRDGDKIATYLFKRIQNMEHMKEQVRRVLIGVREDWKKLMKGEKEYEDNQ